MDRNTILCGIGQPLLLPTDHFARQGKIGHGTPRSLVVEYNRLAMAGRLSQTDIARDDGSVYLVTEMGNELGRNLIGQIVAWIMHGAQYAFDRQARISG